METRYSVKLTQRAYKDLDSIYEYIANELQAEETAMNLVEEIEEAILSLEMFPNRGADRKIGAYANKGYKQLFVKNYVIVYKVIQEKKLVRIATVRYMPSNF